MWIRVNSTPNIINNEISRSESCYESGNMMHFRLESLFHHDVSEVLQKVLPQADTQIKRATKCSKTVQYT